MPNPRLDTTLAAKQVETARGAVRHAMEALAPIVEVIDDERRGGCSRPSTRFPDVAIDLAAASRHFPALCEAADFEADAVLEDLRNAQLLVALIGEVGELAQRLSDSRLVWTSDAYNDCLALYRLAKANDNPRTRALVEPFADMFAARRSRKATEPSA